MTMPESLPARMYLLAYDTDKNRMTARNQLGLVLRAAALADLYLSERLTDENGRPRVAGGRSTGDPVLDDLVQQIADQRPKSWHRWIGRKEHGTVRAVRDQLESEHRITVNRRMLLPDRIELKDRRAVKQYADSVRAALRQSAARAEPRTAAVLALAARGEVKTVVSRHERREQRRRLDELAVYTGPVADALKKALRSKRAAQASASG
ncbi:GPP34 family phosphoprotein [Actinomadura sp. DC4]|uniref:GOLPH3/VPS74 family protein n=1 Tax=Actinomadura sp. DC4 TaxID=3055069 RepID=UPI0025AEE09A|nr:GPP34 family phosphoprotein [Actinomadura sp. DC4]MDN3354646.1 GPP34 family phosphoprotein [Actinomadura sp. DC4]